jgi:hypothetical protein
MVMMMMVVAGAFGKVIQVMFAITTCSYVFQSFETFATFSIDLKFATVERWQVIINSFEIFILTIVQRILKSLLQRSDGFCRTLRIREWPI